MLSPLQELLRELLSATPDSGIPERVFNYDYLNINRMDGRDVFEQWMAPMSTLLHLEPDLLKRMLPAASCAMSPSAQTVYAYMYVVALRRLTARHLPQRPRDHTAHNAQQWNVSVRQHSLGGWDDLSDPKPHVTSEQRRTSGFSSPLRRVRCALRGFRSIRPDKTSSEGRRSELFRSDVFEPRMEDDIPSRGAESRTSLVTRLSFEDERMAVQILVQRAKRSISSLHHIMTLMPPLPEFVNRRHLFSLTYRELKRLGKENPSESLFIDEVPPQNAAFSKQEKMLNLLSPLACDLPLDADDMTDSEFAFAAARNYPQITFDNARSRFMKLLPSDIHEINSSALWVFQARRIVTFLHQRIVRGKQLAGEPRELTIQHTAEITRWCEILNEERHILDLRDLRAASVDMMAELHIRRVQLLHAMQEHAEPFHTSRRRLRVRCGVFPRYVRRFESSERCHCSLIRDGTVFTLQDGVRLSAGVIMHMKRNRFENMHGIGSALDTPFLTRMANAAWAASEYGVIRSMAIEHIIDDLITVDAPRLAPATRHNESLMRLVGTTLLNDLVRAGANVHRVYKFARTRNLVDAADSAYGGGFAVVSLRDLRENCPAMLEGAVRVTPDSENAFVMK